MSQLPWLGTICDIIIPQGYVTNHLLSCAALRDRKAHRVAQWDTHPCGSRLAASLLEMRGMQAALWSCVSGEPLLGSQGSDCAGCVYGSPSTVRRVQDFTAALYVRSAMWGRDMVPEMYRGRWLRYLMSAQGGAQAVNMKMLRLHQILDDGGPPCPRTSIYSHRQGRRHKCWVSIYVGCNVGHWMTYGEQIDNKFIRVYIYICINTRPDINKVQSVNCLAQAERANSQSCVPC
jgi:hypothetical protein